MAAFVNTTWRYHAPALAAQVNVQVWIHAIAHWVIRIDLVIEVLALRRYDAPWRVGQVVSHEFDGVIAVRIDNDDLLASDNGVIVVLVVAAVQPVFLLAFWRICVLPGLPSDYRPLLNWMRRYDGKAFFRKLTRRFSHSFA